MSKYSDKVKKLQVLQMILVVVCLGLIVFFIISMLKPKIVKYEVKDECGPIGGSISHSIDDDDSCSNACSAYCLSLQKGFHESAFIASNRTCNTCDCFCK
ncbi:MAG: hypothetical protein NDI94_04365 [Candidatus Woesearchaeota archaeon]|nr:hypothetical protein [Candidatus Woesearchaeota archaeon]